MTEYKIRMKAFRAIDNLEACQKFVEGHMRVLRIFGITMITSANIEWFMDPNTYVILAESMKDDKVLGGARIQVGGGVYPLPIEKAVAELDQNIYEIVKKYAATGTGELCGLWNSREAAGLGIGSIFLGRACVSIVTQLKLTSLFALCAPATLQNCLKVGFLVEESLGNKGTFYYPKEDLLATALMIKDPTTLTSADTIERENIMDLRINPVQTKIESGPRGLMEMEYDLLINRL